VKSAKKMKTKVIAKKPKAAKKPTEKKQTAVKPSVAAPVD